MSPEELTWEPISLAHPQGVHLEAVKRRAYSFAGGPGGMFNERRSFMARGFSPQNDTQSGIK